MTPEIINDTKKYASAICIFDITIYSGSKKVKGKKKKYALS